MLINASGLIAFKLNRQRQGRDHPTDIGTIQLRRIVDNICGFAKPNRVEKRETAENVETRLITRTVSLGMFCNTSKYVALTPALPPVS